LRRHRIVSQAFRVGPDSSLSLSECFGPASKNFSQRRTLFSPVTVEAIQLDKSSIKND